MHIGRINGVAALTGFSDKKMSGRFTVTKNVNVLTRCS